MKLKVTGVLAAMIAATILFAGAGDGGAASAGQGVSSTDRTHDDLLLDIGRRMPEFGGMYISDGGSVLSVYVTGDAVVSKAVEAERAISGVMAASPAAGRSIRLVAADYTLVQLHGWYGAMQDVVFANPNVVLTDLDEGKNRIEIGVDSLSVESSLRASLAALAIPDGAVIVTARERPVLLSHTLRDRATNDEMEGGYQIKGAGLGECTLGFNVERSGVAGFITNGHCTQTGDYDGGVDGTKFYQPKRSVNSTAIGVEKYDPAFSSSLPGCPSGRVCRYSDAAFIEYSSGTSYNQGKIAKTTTIGSLNVDHSAKFRIIAERTALTDGEFIYKVGRTTGWTGGYVSETCIKVDITGNRTLLCQGIANVRAGEGDSGSPVFSVSSGNDVEILGSLWGANSSGNKIWFSTVGRIYYDLGRNAAWDSCASGYSC